MVSRKQITNFMTKFPAFCAFILLITALYIFGVFSPNGIRAVISNNIWSVQILKRYYQSPKSQFHPSTPPETHPHANLLLARYALSKGFVTDALAHLDPLVESADPYVLDTYAEILFLNNQFESACQIWSQLGREQTLEQVLRYAQEENLPDASFYAAQGLYQINPEKFTTNLASAYKAQLQPATATALLQESIQAYPSSNFQATWFRYLGDIFVQSQDYAAAESAFLQGLTIDPSDQKILRNLGLMYRGHTNQPEKALQVFEKMIALNPKEPYAYFLAAQTYESMDQLDHAVDLYQAVLNFDPENAEALTNLNRLSGVE